MQFHLLARALEILEVELEPFMESVGEARPDDVLAQLLDDPLARTLEEGSVDLASLRTDPRAAATIAALFHLYKNTRAQLDVAMSKLREEPAPSLGYGPGDEVSDFLQEQGNYFEELEELAEKTRRDAALPLRFLSDQVVTALREHHGVEVTLRESRDASTVVRSYDPREGRVEISALLAESHLKFQLCHVLGLKLLDESRLHDRLLESFPSRHKETPRLIKIHLANYFAGALLLPYREFFRAVQTSRYDVGFVARAFESSYEAVAHRMCNLGDRRNPGLPLHFLRVDIAGNISKRYSASGLRFPRGHGSCPRWAVHHAFMTPAVLTRQYSQMPDGSTYFCFARVIVEASAGSSVRGSVYSIGVGTRAENAHHMVYADSLRRPEMDGAAVPTGITCRFCERADCSQRAAPSYKFALAVDEYVKKENFFSPLTSRRDSDD
jgi:predicted transcriptional regulator